MSLIIILMLVWIHFIMDYAVEPTAFKFMREFEWFNKITIPEYVQHSLVYTIGFIPFGIHFAVSNGLFHVVVDGGFEYIIKRCQSSCEGEMKNYVLKMLRGLDQLVHLTIMFILYYVIDKLGYFGW